MGSKVARYWRQRFQRWLDKRNPVERQLVLNHRRIFIFPSRAGLAFLLTLLTLLLLAINYQNNLIFGLCFWLLSLMLVAIMHSYRNLAGIGLRAGAAEPVFAGQTAIFKLYLLPGQRSRQQIHVGFVGQSEQILSVAKSELTYSRELQIHSATNVRGVMNPKHLQLRSYFPLGLLRCWSLIRLDWQCLVYPVPYEYQPLAISHGSGGGEVQDLRGDSDEFSGFRSYQPGDPPRRIHWKALAKGQGLISRYFEQRESQELILDWYALPGMEDERRLSTLCAWALHCDTSGLEFGLRLPGCDISLGSGEAHLERVLAALALAEV
jgi:uncharacterized protein (DUF58 family)